MSIEEKIAKSVKTAADVRTVVSVDLQARIHDPESAHTLEDYLYIRVLRLIANGHPEARTLARSALNSQKLDFPRWMS